MMAEPTITPIGSSPGFHSRSPSASSIIHGGIGASGTARSRDHALLPTPDSPPFACIDHIRVRQLHARAGVAVDPARIRGMHNLLLSILWMSPSASAGKQDPACLAEPVVHLKNGS